MSHRTVICRGITPAILVVGLVSFAFLCDPCAGADEKQPSSYSPVVIPEDFEKTVARMAAAKLQVMERQAVLLHDRYCQEDVAMPSYAGTEPNQPLLLQIGCQPHGS